MMISLYLVVLAIAVAMLAVRVLPAAGWVIRAPRLGLAAWHIVLATLALSMAGAVLALFLRWDNEFRAACLWCLHAAAGDMGTGHRLLAWAMITAGAGLLLRTFVNVIRTAHAMAVCQRKHSTLLRLVARPDPVLEALVVEHPQPAAYLLPGGGGQVVVTSGALDRLPAEQLAAVLAHERAHACERHQLMLTITQVLADALPGFAVFGHSRRQVGRLIELCADDTATAHHRRLDLARALITCAETTGDAPVPAGAAAAGGGDTLERMQRLLNPPAPLRTLPRVAIAAGLTLLAIAPLSIVVAGWMVPALATCMQMG